MLLSSRPGGSFIYYTIAIRKEKVEAGEFFTDFLKAFITFDMAYPIRGGDVTHGQKKEFLAEKWRIIHKNRELLLKTKKLCIIKVTFCRSRPPSFPIGKRAARPAEGDVGVWPPGREDSMTKREICDLMEQLEKK